MIRLIGGLSELADAYDVLLSDVWGVIHNGREVFPEPCAALARWRADVGPVILVSNSPRPHAPVTAQLDGFGVPREAWSALVTSGDATRDLLAERAPGPAFAIGPERDGPLYEGLGLRFSGLEDAAFISCTGPFDDDIETPQDYRDRFVLAVARGLPMICANPDKVVQRGDRLIYCAGALADLYESLGGKVMMAGKPYAPIYRVSLARAATLIGRPLDQKRVLAIGDGVATDVAGANAQGLDVLYVAAGIHAGETRNADGDVDAAKVEQLLAAGGVSAALATDTLAW
jgi:HAD superfamily hydrolase (TIGR01459 family)